MYLKIQHANDALLQHSGELLRAHQVIIDAWYASWVDGQHARAIALRRKRDASEIRADHQENQDRL
jgi:hypothetical protein